MLTTVQWRIYLYYPTITEFKNHTDNEKHKRELPPDYQSDGSLFLVFYVTGIASHSSLIKKP